MHSKSLLTEPSAITSDPMHASFKPASAMIVESAYFAYALLFNSLFLVFLVEGIKREIYKKLIKISVPHNMHLELKNYKHENFVEVSCLY